MTNPAPASPSPVELPQRLTDITGDGIIPESFGWLPGLIAVAGLLCGGLFFAGVRVLGYMARAEELLFGGVFILVGLLMATYEWMRRARRTVLAVRGGTIGVYRNRELKQTIGYGSITRYELNTYNTVRTLIVPVLITLCVVLASLGAFLSLISGKGSLAGDLPWVGAAIWWCLVTASLVNTRIRGKHFIIPKNNTTEEIMLARGDVARLFPSGA